MKRTYINGSLEVPQLEAIGSTLRRKRLVIRNFERSQVYW